MTDDTASPGGLTKALAPLTRTSRGPWATAFLKLWHDRAAMAALGVVILVVLACLLAPAYAEYVSHTDPFRSNLDGQIERNGEMVPVMENSTEGLGLGFTPIGPTWDIRNFFLGADNQGRDVFARLL